MFLLFVVFFIFCINLIFSTPLNILSAIEILSGPEILIIEIAPIPDGDANASMLSFFINAI